MKKSFLLVLLLSCFTVSAQEAKKNVIAKRVANPPKIDGILDDDAWKNVEAAKDFVMLQPTSGPAEPDNQKTEVRIVYDDDAIYFGVYLYDDQDIPTQFATRDNFGASDWFAVILNPNNDSQNDTEFFIQPTGNQLDAKSNFDNRDFNWSAVWDSEVRIVDDGWIVELRIPYSALRFSNDNVQTWGLNFHRLFNASGDQYTWNLVDPSIGNLQQYAGTLSGLENIEPPTRLSFSPYASMGYTTFDGNDSFDKSVGLDVKYGISESFTLDATLIPDFGQTAFDEIRLNLGPFEQQYEEQRPFFTEGTEIFSKGNLFYSRRIGNKPVNYGNGDDLNANEEFIENPDKVNLLNAIKVSGRTKKGLGVGIFNAITERTEAIIKDTITGETRKVVTEPLTNYNVLVLDQQFNKNSSVTFVNTNVAREGSVRSSNVTGLLYDITNKKNIYFVKGEFKTSAVYEGGEKTNGYYLDARVGKDAGNFQYEVGYRMADNKYNINDLGIQNRIDFQRYYFDSRYQIFEPTNTFRTYRIRAWANIRYRQTDGAYMRNHMGIDFRATLLSRFSFSANINGNVGTQNDYYEPRVIDRYYAHAPRQNYRIGIETDGSKKFSIEVNLRYGTRKPEDHRYFNIDIEPTYRFSDKFTIEYSFDSRNTKDEKGYVDILDDDSIIFGNRDRKEITNALTGQYNFSVKSALSLTFRHYWSPITYDSFYLLEEDGTLTPHPYDENHDINYNIWNLDLSYVWEFAPGSQLVALYRNNIFNEDTKSQLEFDENLRNLFNEPSQHNISLKLIYYIDYNNMRKWFKKKA